MALADRSTYQLLQTTTRRLRRQTVSRQDSEVTSACTLDEMAITGIFKTSNRLCRDGRSNPDKNCPTRFIRARNFSTDSLSRSRKIELFYAASVKMSNNKFIASVENKTLRQYSDSRSSSRHGSRLRRNHKRQQTQTQTQQTENSNPNTTGTTQTTTTQSDIVISPLDEMNRQQQTEQQETKRRPNRPRNLVFSKKVNKIFLIFLIFKTIHLFQTEINF